MESGFHVKMGFKQAYRNCNGYSWSKLENEIKFLPINLPLPVLLFIILLNQVAVCSSS